MTTPGERGAALLVVLFTLTLVSAVAAVLVVGASTETLLAAHAGAQSEALAAADAVLARTVAELRAEADLSATLDGRSASRFVDGPPGARTLPDGSTVDLAELVNLANCNRPRPCTMAELDASAADRPWGPRNPRWRLYSWGPLVPPVGAPASGVPVYVVSMVADDPAETDGAPLIDGGGPTVPANPGTGIVLVRGEAYGRRGARRVVEASVVRLDVVARAAWAAADPATRGTPPAPTPYVQIRGWREVR